jgi:hypothetical protein
MGNQPWKFLDAEVHPPPTNKTLMLFSNTGSITMGAWQEGFIGWCERPTAPASLREKVIGGQGWMSKKSR